MGKPGAPAALQPRATDHVPEMVALIERLVASGVAYVVDGDVYFEVLRFPARTPVGQLDELLTRGPGRRQRAGSATPGLRAWKTTSPTNHPGRAGGGPAGPAGIECSAMAMKYLGETADLHGGEDLIFPTSCEIAQSEAATGSRSRGSGCTTASSTSGPRRCPSRWEYADDRGAPEAARSRGPAALPPPDPLPEPRGVHRGGRSRGCDARSSDSGSWATRSASWSTKPAAACLPMTRNQGGRPFGRPSRRTGAVRGRDGRRFQHPAGDRRPEPAHDDAGRGAEGVRAGARSEHDFVKGVEAS